ncbi:MAG: murein hydrolase activator EnvC family protein [Fusobacteriaceae bacterium]
MNIKKIGILIFTLFFLTSYGAANVNTAKKELKAIENKIQDQNTKIKKIDNQKESIEVQIKNNEKDIEEIKKDQKKLQEEIKEVRKSLASNKKELRLNDNELKKMQMIQRANIIAWNRYSTNNLEGEVSEIDRLSVVRLVSMNMKNIEEVQTIVVDIKKDTQDIEKKKKSLENLNYRSNLNAKKLNRKIVEQENLVKKLNKEKIGRQSIVSDLKKKKQRIEREIERIISSRAKKSTTPVKYTAAKKGIGRLGKPLNGPIVVGYNQKKNGISINGIEIRGELGSTIKSSSKGKVIYSDDFQGLGKVVMIEYGYNLIGVYGNLISTNVKVGDMVAKAENIGVLGYSNDGQPDLYYEVRFNLKPVDPESFF